MASSPSSASLAIGSSADADAEGASTDAKEDDDDKEVVVSASCITFFLRLAAAPAKHASTAAARERAMDSLRESEHRRLKMDIHKSWRDNDRKVRNQYFWTQFF